ncbi:MAG: MBOAT family protein [Clostridia bacterium]|nr:MBOAT family protein [Clostridia bacterium]
MRFASVAFPLFLAALLGLWAILPRRARPWLLLLASAAFYLCAGLGGIVFLAGVILLSWGAGLLLRREQEKQKAQIEEEAPDRARKKEIRAVFTRRKKRILRCALGILLLDLFLVKYLDFVIRGGASLFGADPASFPGLGIIVPLGISYFTFSAIGYLIDVFRGTCGAEKNPARLALFLSFFPIISQGPICRYGDLSETLFEGENLKGENLSRGAMRIAWGYFKKIVLADRLAPAIAAIFADPSGAGGMATAAAILMYTFRLYFDFTGGIDITIGVGELFGIRLPENFNLPYFSGSLKEYWRRWHITMCSWFRDYLFYPVSTSGFMTKLSGKIRTRVGPKAAGRVVLYVSSFLVWAATGIWHGAGMNFLVWGLCNWAVLMISEELEPLYKRFHDRFGFRGKAWRVFMILRTFLLVAMLNLFDCFDGVGGTFGAAAALFAPWDPGKLALTGLEIKDILILLFGGALVFAVSLIRTKVPDLRGAIARRGTVACWAVIFGFTLAVLLLGAYGIGYDQSAFIYNRF